MDSITWRDKRNCSNANKNTESKECHSSSHWIAASKTADGLENAKRTTSTQLEDHYKGGLEREKRKTGWAKWGTEGREEAQQRWRKSGKETETPCQKNRGEKTEGIRPTCVKTGADELGHVECGHGISRQKGKGSTKRPRNGRPKGLRGEPRGGRDGKCRRLELVVQARASERRGESGAIYGGRNQSYRHGAHQGDGWKHESKKGPRRTANGGGWTKAIGPRGLVGEQTSDERGERNRGEERREPAARADGWWGRRWDLRREQRRSVKWAGNQCTDHHRLPWWIADRGSYGQSNPDLHCDFQTDMGGKLHAQATYMQQQRKRRCGLEAMPRTWVGHGVRIRIWFSYKGQDKRDQSISSMKLSRQGPGLAGRIRKIIEHITPQMGINKGASASEWALYVTASGDEERARFGFKIHKNTERHVPIFSLVVAAAKRESSAWERLLHTR